MRERNTHKREREERDTRHTQRENHLTSSSFCSQFRKYFLGTLRSSFFPMGKEDPEIMIDLVEMVRVHVVVVRLGGVERRPAFETSHENKKSNEKMAEREIESMRRNAATLSVQSNMRTWTSAERWPTAPAASIGAFATCMLWGRHLKRFEQNSSDPKAQWIGKRVVSLKHFCTPTPCLAISCDLYLSNWGRSAIISLSKRQLREISFCCLRTWWLVANLDCLTPLLCMMSLSSSRCIGHLCFSSTEQRNSSPQKQGMRTRQGTLKQSIIQAFFASKIAIQKRKTMI